MAPPEKFKGEVIENPVANEANMNQIQDTPGDSTMDVDLVQSEGKEGNFDNGENLAYSGSTISQRSSDQSDRLNQSEEQPPWLESEEYQEIQRSDNQVSRSHLTQEDEDEDIDIIDGDDDEEEDVIDGDDDEEED